MLDFYKQQTNFNDDVFARWREWCVDHAEPTGTYSEFVGRLSRCHIAQLRVRCGRAGHIPALSIGQPKAPKTDH
ncbi:hypothetical protein NC656_09290 [Pseudomonas asiatica]|uniref:hypothetical protein n=1 Tax=Pseudomonas asiatica TaxID=2219225 RepID=UPI00209C4D53|nr:hypothetical protein [Pseudomonas asiatica]MCO8261741.1 hypothetical protein [Pseudomonas asiatica]